MNLNSNFRAHELCESRGGRPGLLPSLIVLAYGLFCGRKSNTEYLNLNPVATHQFSIMPIKM